MISLQQIKLLVRQRDFSLSDYQVDATATMLLDDISNCRYDFSNYSRNVFTQQGKKRIIYAYPKFSCEDILCQYLKRQLDLTFGIKYASRSQIMNMLFNVLPIVKDLNDFVIVRIDFKSFFDSVMTKHVYDKYIKESSLKRSDKELFELYTNVFKYCYAGLCLSNGMTEIVCRDFDESIKAKLSQHGVFFYERYVDDIIIILNKYISKGLLLELMNETVKEIFGNSPVKLATSPDKFTYIAKRELSPNDIAIISFLGYEFSIMYLINDGESEFKFKFGITEKKRKKYGGIMERAVIQFKHDNNIELLRQRIKIYSSRVVVGRATDDSTFDWLTKGLVANYNELRHHMDSLIPETESFMKKLYFDLFRRHGITPIPYFLIQSCRENSIYNILSNMRRNRTLVFQEKMGVSRYTLIYWIKKINPSYNDIGKEYYQVVMDYLSLIKIE